ncbi:MAG: SPOR domain-containing protein [Thermodesulfobacteriota bacterium]|nr:SPOR domain-containing protein [Thermodesulfobacteriota bacterium]
MLLWIFTLGIIVSRGLFNDAMNSLATIKEKDITTIEEKEIRDKEVMPQEHVLPIKEEELTFYKELTQKKEIAKEKTLSGSSFNEKKAKPEKPSPRLDELAKNKDKSATKEKIKRIRASILNYNVQVAALKNKGDSKRMVKKLIGLGYPAYYYQTLINGELYYRIRCGPLSTLTEAKKYAKRLSDNEGFRPFIIHPNQNN